MRFSEKSRNRNRRAARLAKWLCSVGCLIGLVVAASIGLTRIRAQESFPLPAINPPGAKAQASQANATSTTQKPTESATKPDGPPVARECADLLEMATELKTEVDKTTKDTLSVAVVRKAGEIEQFAHKVRTTAGKN